MHGELSLLMTQSQISQLVLITEGFSGNTPKNSDSQQSGTGSRPLLLSETVFYYPARVNFYANAAFSP